MYVSGYLTTVMKTIKDLTNNDRYIDSMKKKYQKTKNISNVVVACDRIK